LKQYFCYVNYNYEAKNFPEENKNLLPQPISGIFRALPQFEQIFFRNIFPVGQINNLKKYDEKNEK